MITSELNMQRTRAFPANRENIAFKAIVFAWLAAGTLDICAAFTTAAIKGGAPAMILKSIASGLLGANAFRGGNDIAAMGLALHFAIMFGIVLVFWFASRKLFFMVDKAFFAGLAYGVVVFAVMNLVVLPLSAISFKPNYSVESLIMGIGVHMLCVGLPIALLIRKFGGVASTAGDKA